MLAWEDSCWVIPERENGNRNLLINQKLVN